MNVRHYCVENVHEICGGNADFEPATTATDIDGFTVVGT